MNERGFPRTGPKTAKHIRGFQTGDIVRAVVATGKKAGVHVGRVLVRASGSFDIRTDHSRISGINARYCRAVHRCDGYSYTRGEAI
jgi:lipoate-protein ligase A